MFGRLNFFLYNENSKKAFKASKKYTAYIKPRPIFQLASIRSRKNLKFEGCHNNMAAATDCQKAREMNGRRYGANQNDLRRPTRHDAGLK